MPHSTPKNLDVLEKLKNPDRIPHMRMIFDQTYCTSSARAHSYPGNGTAEDPYIVSWLDSDPRDPYNWSLGRRAFITCCISASSLAAALSSSAYTGSTDQIMQEFGVGTEMVTLGLSLFVLGFAVGPLLFAPLSELYGRQILFVSTYFALAAFNAGAAGAQNIQTLLVIRFLAGAFGSSPLTNAGGQIADMFGADLVGLAMSLFVAAPFVGPALGPIIGGFLAETVGWRWVEGFLAIFTGAMWLLGTLVIPETYAPTLLKKRAQKLSFISGKVYKSKLEMEKGAADVKKVFARSLGRPWVLLFFEPIVLLLAIYMAIVYGTLYMFFAAFPIVYQEQRGWSEGLGGLAFVGVAVGMLSGCAYAIPENIRYNTLRSRSEGTSVPPEQRLWPMMISAVWLPIGLFWFAWTSSPDISPYASIAAGAPFSFGMVLTYLSTVNYLVDGYTVYAASALASNTILRSLFGFAFPLFAEPMYRNLGIHWASCVPAFLALACVPCPFLLYKYGPSIRKRCKYAAEAERVRMMLAEKHQHGESTPTVPDNGGSSSETGPQKERSAAINA